MLNFTKLTFFITVRLLNYLLITRIILAPSGSDVAPSLTPMRDVVVQEGSPAQFKTCMSGSPTPNIQWYREGELIPQSPDFQVNKHFY